ncbi:MAG: hypothetical protein ABFR31_10490 [Thermodesulfobacteriota bacterium]
METEPENIDYKELKTYCPDCGKIIFKGIVLSLAIACHHCNKFVRIKNRFSNNLT